MSTICILTPCCGPVHSYGSQHGGEPGNLAETDSTPVMTSEPLPQEAICDGPCFEMVSTNGSSDLTFQNSSRRSRHNLMPLRDVYSSPTPASSLNSSSLVVGSKLIQNVKLEVLNAKNDSSFTRVVYGPIYRLRKLHGASGSRTAPASSKPPVSSSVTSKPVPTSQNGYKSRLSQISYDSTRLGKTYNAVTSTSRNAPSRSNMVISSGPIITFVKPNQTEVVQTIKTQSSYEPGASKPLTFDQPTAQASETSQGMGYQRPAHSFKSAQATYMQQMARPVQSGQQLAGFSRDAVYNRSSTAVRLRGSGYRLIRPGYVSSTSISTGTSTHVPSSSTKPAQSDHMRHSYQAGLSSPGVGYHSTSSAVVSVDSNYGFVQSGNVYGPADNAQPAVSSSNLSQNPYFVTRQGQSYMFKPLQSDYKSLPTRYMQMPSRSFSVPLSQPASVQEHLNRMIKQMSDIQALTSGGVPTSRHYGSVLDSNAVGSGYIVDQTSNQQGVKPSQQIFRPLSFGSPQGQYVSQPGSRFVLRGSRPVLNF